MYRLCACLEILSHVEHWEATELVVEIDEGVAYSFARCRTSAFLAGAGAAPERLVDGLWDCEDAVVELGLESAAGTPAVAARRAELACSPWHDEDLRLAAR